MSLADVAGGGDRAATLRALRDRLAAQIDRCDSARDVAALSRQLTDVLAQIDGVGGRPSSREDETFDELERRRAHRGLLGGRG